MKTKVEKKLIKKQAREAVQILNSYVEIDNDEQLNLLQEKVRTMHYYLAGELNMSKDANKEAIKAVLKKFIKVFKQELENQRESETAPHEYLDLNI